MKSKSHTLFRHYILIVSFKQESYKLGVSYKTNIVYDNRYLRPQGESDVKNTGTTILHYVGF